MDQDARDTVREELVAIRVAQGALEEAGKMESAIYRTCVRGVNTLSEALRENSLGVVAQDALANLSKLERSAKRFIAEEEK